MDAGWVAGCLENSTGVAVTVSEWGGTYAATANDNRLKLVLTADAFDGSGADTAANYTLSGTGAGSITVTTVTIGTTNSADDTIYLVTSGELASGTVIVEVAAGAVTGADRTSGNLTLDGWEQGDVTLTMKNAPSGDGEIAIPVSGDDTLTITFASDIVGVASPAAGLVTANTSTGTIDFDAGSDAVYGGQPNELEITFNTPADASEIESDTIVLDAALFIGEKVEDSDITSSNAAWSQ